MPLRVLYFVTIAIFILVAISYFLIRSHNRQATAVSSSFSPKVWLKATPVELHALRLPITLLLISGLLLIWLGQLIVQKVPPHVTQQVWVLIGVGGVLFVAAGQTAVRQKLWVGVARPLSALCRIFQLASWQLLLLFIAPLFAWLTSLAAGDRLIANSAPVANFSWLIVIGCVVALLYRKEESTVLSRWELRLLAFLFVLGLAVRGLLTAEFPATFSGDEGSAGLVAVQFFEGDVDNLFVTGWFSFPSFYFAVQSVGIHIWGQTVQAARLISAFAGGLTVVATYWMVRKLFDPVTAVFAAAYLAVSHYHIHFSRIALNNVWDSLFGAVAIYGFWDGWKNGRRTGYLWCALSLGIGMYFYVSIRVLPLIFLIWSLVAFISKRQQFLKRLPDLVLTAVGSAIIALPIGLHFYRYPAQFSAPLNRVTILGPWLEAEVAKTGMTAASIVARQMWLGLLGFTFQPLRLFYEPGAPLLLTGAATLFLIGVVWSVLNIDLRYLLLLLPLLAAVVSNGLSQSPPASQRFILTMPMVATFVALPLGFMTNWLISLWPDRRWVAYGITAVIFLVISYQDLEYYFFQAPQNYIFGGVNTLVATEVADYLSERPADERVYFFGLPRMGYFSHSTVPYLAPHIVGIDVADPLRAPPTWDLSTTTHFMFLPERTNDLRFVEMAYPNGEYIQIFNERNQELLVIVYRVDR